MVSQRIVSERIVKEGRLMKTITFNEKVDYVGRFHQITQAAMKESQENQILYQKKRLERKRLNNEIST